MPALRTRNTPSEGRGQATAYTLTSAVYSGLTRFQAAGRRMPAGAIEDAMLLGAIVAQDGDGSWVPVITRQTSIWALPSVLLCCLN